MEHGARAPTAVNTSRTTRGRCGWFEQNVVPYITVYVSGFQRKVYPDFLQLAGFMAMNLGNHLVSH